MKSEIIWQWHSFDDLSLVQLQAMFALRQDVFIIEQDCPYPDIDGKDQQAFHLLAWLDNQLVATLRVFESYHQYQNMASIGRICTHQSIRKDGVGRVLVAKAIEFIEENYPNKSIQIGAQHYLKGFYEEFGFKRISDIYLEDGIEHILMLKQ
jgi:ElaA protein